jgi:hypothetical protein
VFVQQPPGNPPSMGSSPFSGGPRLRHSVRFKDTQGWGETFPWPWKQSIMVEGAQRSPTAPSSLPFLRLRLSTPSTTPPQAFSSRGGFFGVGGWFSGQDPPGWFFRSGWVVFLPGPPPEPGAEAWCACVCVGSLAALYPAGRITMRTASSPCRPGPGSPRGTSCAEGRPATSWWGRGARSAPYARHRGSSNKRGGRMGEGSMRRLVGEGSQGKECVIGKAQGKSEQRWGNGKVKHPGDLLVGVGGSNSSKIRSSLPWSQQTVPHPQRSG